MSKLSREKSRRHKRGRAKFEHMVWESKRPNRYVHVRIPTPRYYQGEGYPK